MSILKRYPQFNNLSTNYSNLYGNAFSSALTGETVNEYTSLGISAVLSSVSLLADTVASMKLSTFKTVAGKRVSIPLPEVLCSPDPESTTYEMIHQFVATQALHGNSYSLLSRDRMGDVFGILNLHPYQVQVQPGNDNATRRYLHMGNEIDPEDMLHQRWFTPPQSLVGISPLSQNRNLVGISLAVDRSLAQFYGEGGTPSSIITLPGKLTAEVAKEIVDNWQATHSRHRKPSVLSGGAKWEPITTNAADSQVMAFREQLIRDIARVFRIPSHLILASGDNQTYQNVEQASLNFLTHTIQPWLVRLELALSRVLPKGIDVEFDTSSLLRADALSRAKVNQLNINMGARNPNEVRLSEGLDPYEGGDVFHQAMVGNAIAGGAFPALGEEPDPVKAPLDGSLPNAVDDVADDQARALQTRIMERELSSTSFSVEAPIVNVDAPIIRVEQPDITVEAPAVTINNLQPRSRVTRTVIRDEQGRVASIVDDIEDEVK